MKELSQYKEEIFRRSEEKIRQRKKQRRIAVGVCIPLCLCLVIGGVGLMPKMAKDANFAPEMAPDRGTPNIQYSSSLAVSEIQDIALWEEILKMPQAENADPGDPREEAEDIADNAGALRDDAGTRIIQVGQDRYQLTGNTLYCEKTGEVQILTQAQLQKLEALLTQEAEPEGQSRFTARVLECSDSWVLVEPLEGESERNSSDKISFGTVNLEPLDIQVGDLVTVTYNGMIMESYPAQIVASHWEFVSTKGK